MTFSSIVTTRFRYVNPQGCEVAAALIAPEATTIMSLLQVDSTLSLNIVVRRHAACLPCLRPLAGSARSAHWGFLRLALLGAVSPDLVRRL